MWQDLFSVQIHGAVAIVRLKQLKWGESRDLLPLQTTQSIVNHLKSDKGAEQVPCSPYKGLAADTGLLCYWQTHCRLECAVPYVRDTND